MVVMPLGGVDGKEPLVKWRTWKAPVSEQRIAAFVDRFPTANIGLICGASGITVVDIDDAAIIPDMMERSGTTPMITASPRGGVHLWYRSSGEGCHDLHPTEGLKVQIKGIGGQVAVPPSVRLGNDDHAGRPYRFVCGSWDALRRPLPKIPPSAIPAKSRKISHTEAVSSPRPSIVEGLRNATLFQAALRYAKGAPDVQTLRAHVEAVNATFDPPLDRGEIERLLQSAWKYQTSGNNWVGKEQQVQMPISQLNALTAFPNAGNATLLALNLKAAHWGKPCFPVAPRAMAELKFIPGWGEWTYRAALKTALAAKVLKRVRHGGRGPNDPALFAFESAGT